MIEEAVSRLTATSQKGVHKDALLLFTESNDIPRLPASHVTHQDLFCEPLVRYVSQDKAGGYIFEIQNAAFVLRPEFRRKGIGTRSVAKHRGHVMNPCEIAVKVCRPMSTEVAMQLTLARHGSREFPDIEPELEAEILRMGEKLERERLIRRSSPSLPPPPAP